MRRIPYRIVSALISIVFVVGFCPVFAFADDEGYEIEDGIDTADIEDRYGQEVAIDTEDPPVREDPGDVEDAFEKNDRFDATAHEAEEAEQDAELLVATPEAYFNFSFDGSGCIISGYTGMSPDIVVPAAIGGMPVTRISIDGVLPGSTKLTTLDVSACTELTYLDCACNRLTSLDVSKNKKLMYLLCDVNRLTSLDVNANAALQYISLASNRLSSLDLTKNTALISVTCSHNTLSNLDLSKNSALETVDCTKTGISALDLRGCHSLRYLFCGLNGLTSLDVSKNPELTALDCSNNGITMLDISKNPKLESLTCNYNRIRDTKSLEAWRSASGQAGSVLPQNIAVQFTVTFKDWDGKVLKTQKVESGKAATAPADPTRAGYTFLKWDKSFSKVTANIAVNAVYIRGGDASSSRNGTITELAGQDRYDTARMVNKAELAANGNKAFRGVIVASAEEGKFADALCATGLAGMLDYPIVLTNGSSGSLNAQTRSAIQKLSGETGVDVIVIGSSATVSAGIEKDLARLDSDGKVTRIGGKDRYETNMLIYEYGAKRGVWSTDWAIIATGSNFPDALGVSSYAAAKKAPVFLIDSKAMSLTPAVKKALGLCKRAVVLGDVASVSVSVYNAAAKIVGSSMIERVSGTNRYATGVACARWQLAQGMKIQNAGFATGQDFPDALASGFLLGKTDSILMLMSPVDSENAAAVSLLKSKGSPCTSIKVFGGKGSVSAAARNQVVKAFGWAKTATVKVTALSDGDSLDVLEEGADALLLDEDGGGSSEDELAHLEKYMDPFAA